MGPHFLHTHARNGVPHAVINGFEIDLDRFVERTGTPFFELCGFHVDPDTVDTKIQPAIALVDRLGACGEGRLVANVDLHCERNARRETIRRQIESDDSRILTHKHLDNGAADTVASIGEDANLSSKFEALIPPLALRRGCVLRHEPGGRGRAGSSPHPSELCWASPRPGWHEAG